MALWTPAEIATSLWLDASDLSTIYDTSVGGSLVADGGSVGRWEDKSGNARHAIQATAGNRPVRSGTSISFQDKWLSVPTASFDLNRCVVGVLDADATGWTSGGLLTITSTPVDNPDVRFGIVGGDAFSAYWGGGYVINQTTGYGMLTSSVHAFAIETGIKITLWRNGTQTVTGTRAATWNSITEFTIGKFLRFAAQVGRHGTARELVICGPSDRVINEGYLAWKWGFEGSLAADHPYKNAAPSTGSSAAAVHFFTFGF